MKPKLLRSVTTEAIAKWAVSLIGKERNATTVGVYCRHLRASLNWAKDMGYIAEAPKVKVPKPPADARTMKGRPIVAEEHERILAAAAKVVPPHQLESWERFLSGLWWSGLRLSEALRLSWSESAEVAVVEASGVLAMRFKPQGHKARRAEVIPCAPEFAELLQATPERERRGKVFPLSHFKRSGELAVDTVGGLISDMATLAGVWVTDTKPATAHDYRRAFGTRWSRRVKPATLQKLMRHRDIQTTMKYYVEQDLADMVADMMAAMGNNLSNTQSKQPTFSAK